MCLKILVLTIVTVSASKIKDNIRVQYLGPPKTDFESDGLKPRDSFGGNADRKFGGRESEEKYKLSVPSFDNHRSLNEEFNHRQFRKHNNDHGFQNFGRDFGSQSNFASGSTERNYRKSIETGFRQNTHEIRPLVLGNLDHSVGFESSDKEVRVRDRSIESHRRHSSSNNFKHDNSFQGSSQTFYSSGSDGFHTESLGNKGDNQREFNSRFHQGGHGNHFKSHDFENSNKRSESSYGDFRGSDQRESGSKNEKQFEIIIDTNNKTEGAGGKSDFDQNKGLKEIYIVSTTEKATINRNHKNYNEKSYQENTDANNYNVNLHTNERDLRRDSEDNYGSSHSTDSRNSEEEINPRAPDRNTSLPEEYNNRNRNNADTTENKNVHASGPSGVVGRRIDHDNTNQRVDKPNKTDGRDEWTWGEEEEKRTTTTKLPDIGDRSAFNGDKCPTGKVKIGNMCVTPD